MPGYLNKICKRILRSRQGWVRTSQYMIVRDGTKLATDIFRPAKNGKPIIEPLPVIWTHHRYHRASLEESKLPTHVSLRNLLLAFAKRLIGEPTIRTQLDNTPWLET